jgi:hypothetical protein
MSRRAFQFLNQKGNLHIPVGEIKHYLKTLAQYALGISDESLIVETAKIFGFKRAGEKSRKRFFDVYTRLLWEKKLFCDNGLVIAAWQALKAKH